MEFRVSRVRLEVWLLLHLKQRCFKQGIESHPEQDQLTSCRAFPSENAEKTIRLPTKIRGLNPDSSRAGAGGLAKEARPMPPQPRRSWPWTGSAPTWQPTFLEVGGTQHFGLSDAVLRIWGLR